MQRPLLFLATTALLWHGLAVVGQAQLIQVRPRYVRAPFVRVYSNPDGSSHVRAPFVNINSPGYGSSQYVAPGGETVLDEPVSEMDAQSLNFAVLESVARFEVELHKLPTGDFWRSHLKIDETNRIVTNDSAGDFVARDQKLQPIVAIYDATSEADEMQQIANMPSFQSVHAALREFVMSPEQRLRRQLHSAFQQLNNELEGHETAAQWRSYLALPLVNSNSIDREPASHSPSLIEMAIALSRYDSVSRSMQYRQIAKFAGFEMTHRRLAEYYQILDPPISTSSVVEELPPPIPSPPTP